MTLAGEAERGLVTRVDTVIVGAGFAGIGMALALQRSGRGSFVILERGDAVGGTWRDNTYPGVACDVPSHLYGFSGHPNPAWSGLYARGGEIRDYLERVVSDEGLRDHLRLRTPLLGADWDAACDRWLIETPTGTIEAAALVLACGRLTQPRVPEVPGLETFPGAMFHSARWDHSVDLAGARVAVVGTGASAVQLVPELARTAAHVTLFQRTPAWIVPRGARPYSRSERRRFARDPSVLSTLREELFTQGEARFASRAGDPEASAAARAEALAHLDRQVEDPALRAALTPDYAFGCKRVLLSDEFYPAVASPAVTLEASALADVSGSTLSAASGARFDADVLVLATGFESARQPYAQLVRGEGGVSLAEHWSLGMTSFASTVVAGFAGLFVLNGPNASLGHNSAVLMAEEQADYVVRCLAVRDATGGRALRVRPEAEAAYTAEVERASAGTAWVAGGCRNWYVDERSGRLTLLWPGTVAAFRDRLARADGSEFESASLPARGGAA